MQVYKIVQVPLLPCYEERLNAIQHNDFYSVISLYRNMLPVPLVLYRPSMASIFEQNGLQTLILCSSPSKIKKALAETTMIQYWVTFRHFKRSNFFLLCSLS